MDKGDIWYQRRFGEVGEGHAILSLQPLIEVGNGNVSTDNSAVPKSCPTDWHVKKYFELLIRCYVFEIGLMNKILHCLYVNEI